MDTKVRPFFERYGRVVLDRARFLLGDGDAAKDALQEVLLRAVTSEAHILDEPSPASWLHRVTTNLCLNRLRDDKRRKELLTERDQARNDGSGAAPDDPETRVTVLQILNRMPQAIQEIAVYRFVDEMTHEEIADRVGVSPRTVGNRLVTFQQRMSAILQPQ